MLDEAGALFRKAITALFEAAEGRREQAVRSVGSLRPALSVTSFAFRFEKFQKRAAGR